MITLNDVTTKEQIEQTAQLASEIWHQHFTPIIGAAQVEYMLKKFQSAGAMTRQIADEGYTYLIALGDDGSAVGYTAFHPDGNRMFLSKLYVKKEYRGNGISRQILNEIIKRSNGLCGIYLTVNKHNDTTIAIYKHMGFRLIDSVVTDIEGGFVMDDYIFQLDLK